MPWTAGVVPRSPGGNDARRLAYIRRVFCNLRVITGEPMSATRTAITGLTGAAFFLGRVFHPVAVEMFQLAGFHGESRDVSKVQYVIGHR